MPAPFAFPGMDPWLEHPSLWSDVHFRIIAALARHLRQYISSNYIIAVETRTYITTPSAVTVHYPEVAVMIATRQEQLSAGAVLARIDPIKEHYLEIRDSRSGEVITAIEVLSPTNKIPGDGRNQYLIKRQEILITRTNLVEIDLLRAGLPMPYEGKSQASHYRILIRRGREGRRAYLYPFNLQEAIPTFPLPLQEDDEEPTIDLNPLLRQIYAEAAITCAWTTTVRLCPNLPPKIMRGRRPYFIYRHCPEEPLS